MADRMLYFAYGSNLSLEQMNRRCPGARPVCRAWLDGYQLVFPRPAPEWEGGVAGIEPHGEDLVEGAVYEINAGHLATLDEYEGIDEGEYTRDTIRVVTDEGGEMEVITYFCNRLTPGHHPPSERYVRTLLAGAHDHGLSRGWVERLERLLEPDRVER